MNLLLIENDAAEAGRVRTLLGKPRLKTVRTVDEAVSSLRAQPADVVILGIDLTPKGVSPALSSLRAASDAALVVLSSTDDEMLCAEAVRAGADNYLLSSKMTSECLNRAVVMAAARRDIRLTAASLREKLETLVRRCEQ